ncbi:MAG: hypothetical protein HOM11_12570 [Methylococcales bacterium]|jgi:hypothetical protein|nr:hypothetical protein [Methylococcales bacterium]MBT7445460.1 hypothetical protein [Methylococcales bacterium]
MTLSRFRKPLIISSLLLASNAHAITVDVLVLYTQDAQNSTSSIETKINQYIESSNAVYRDSGLDLKLRLAHTQVIDIADTEGVTGTGLDNLRRSAQVQRLREQFGADATALISKAVPNGNGLITCGIGYVGQGRNGQLSSSSKDIAYSMSAIDCGASTFTHELGHNFGLGHSRKQGSTGGVFDHGVGYGVDNRFTTVMAYDFIFNAVDINKFSSPALSCNGVPCGVAAGSSDSADAVAAIKPIIQQFANFFPSNETEPDPDDGGDTPTADPVNPVPDNGYNLTENATFETGTSNWTAPYGGDLATSQIARKTGERSLAVTNRDFFYSGPIQDLNGKMNAGETYIFSAWVKLAEGTDTFRFALGINDDDGLSYTSTDSVGVNAETWTKVSGELTATATGDVSQMLVLGYGPQADKDFFIDDFRVEPSVIPEPEPEVVNLIQNGGFEEGSTAFWEKGFDGKLFLSTRESNTGTYSLASYDRTVWYHGIKQNLTGIQKGSTYTLSLSGLLHSSSISTDDMIVYLYTRDAGGDHWTKVKQQTISNVGWTNLSDVNITVNANGTLTSASLYIMSANKDNIFYVDDVSFIEQ